MKQQPLQNRQAPPDHAGIATSPLDADRLLRETFVARVEHLPTLGSTNDLAKGMAAHGAAPLPLLIVADEQTSGRGRGPNRWWTGPGSLACSLLVDARDLEIEPGDSPLVALSAAVAVVDTVTPRLPSHQVGLHWPNDVYVEGRKLAGVLVEVLAKGRMVVVGIGLNNNNSARDAPPELQKTAATLFDLTGIPHDRTRLLQTLLNHLAARFRQLASSPEQIAARADSLCLQRGRVLTIERGQARFRGRCSGIGSDGALLLTTPEGEKKFYSGVLG